MLLALVISLVLGNGIFEAVGSGLAAWFCFSVDAYADVIAGWNRVFPLVSVCSLFKYVLAGVFLGILPGSGAYWLLFVDNTHARGKMYGLNSGCVSGTD